MDNLNVAKFDPLKAEVTALVENIKKTAISIPGDKTGYELMKENKKLLQSKRNDLTRTLKSEREGALAYQKGIIAIEKDLLAIIEPVESDLDQKIKEIDDAEKRAQRVAILPERKEKLASIELQMTDEEILDMDDKFFAEFFVTKRMAYLEAKQAKIDERERLAEEKERKQAEKEKREKDMAKARADGERLAKEKADKESADKAAAEKAENERLEKIKKYQKFLADNGCTKETKAEFYIKKEETKVVLYKKVGEFKI